jgi:hypothetical protein
MGLIAPDGTEFQYVDSNITNTRPVAGMGTAIPLASGATTTVFSPWVDIASENIATKITYDCYGMLLCFNNFGATNTIINGLANIAIDTTPAGSNYSANIIISNLMMSSATPYNLPGNGIWYYFPLYIPAQSSVGIQGKGTVNTANPSVAAWFFSKPKRPEMVRAGAYVDSYGIDSGANNRGTTITIGTTADGANTLIGTATRDGWWTQCCFAQADASQTAGAVAVDVMAGSSTTVNKYLIWDQPYGITAAEQISNVVWAGNLNKVVNGDNIYARAQSSTTADTGPNIGVYVVGG